MLRIPERKLNRQSMVRMRPPCNFLLQFDVSLARPFLLTSSFPLPLPGERRRKEVGREEERRRNVNDERYQL